MNQERKEGFSKWILAALVTTLLSIVALLQYSPQATTKIDLTKRVDEAELVMMRPGSGDQALVFSFELRGNPEEDARQYLPLLKYLEAETGLKFRLQFTPQSHSLASDLGTGKIDFAAIGASTFIQAEARYDVSMLARGVNSDGQPAHRSVIIVGPGSPIQTIAELRGLHFAFGEETSTLGYLIPRIMMAENGLELTDLKSFEIADSHHNTVNVVASRQCDAGGLQDLLGRRFEAQGLVRTILTSKYYPSGGIAASPDVPGEVAAMVKRALLKFEPNGAHAAGLYHWDRTEMASGFVDAGTEDYAELRDWCVRFALLAPQKKGEGP